MTPGTFIYAAVINSFQDPNRYKAVTDFFPDSSKKGKEQQTLHHDPLHPDVETTLEQTDTRWNT